VIENILITSAGRRVRLVQNFQAALKKFNSRGKVFTVDKEPELSSACRLSDGYFSLPPVTSKSYIGELAHLCLEHNISLIVPTIDTELSILAAVKSDFEKKGIKAAVSSKKICDTFRSKQSTERFFRQHGFDTPKIFKNRAECRVFPLFAKFDNSSASQGAKKIDSRAELDLLAPEGSGYVIQEYIEGEEYTVDLFMDRYSHPLCIVPRKRLEVRAGEVSKAVTEKDREIIESIKNVAKYLDGGYGCITVQLFRTERGLVFIEINPRFGGGYPLTWQSGADFAEMLIEDFLGIENRYHEERRDKTLMLRYDAEVIV